MSSSQSRSRFGAVVLVCLSVVALAGIAAAGSDPILACVHKTTGAVRIVADAGDCTTQEASVSWASSSGVGAATYYVAQGEQVFDAPLTNPLPDPLPTEPPTGQFITEWAFENYQVEYPELVVSCALGDVAVSGVATHVGLATLTTSSGSPISETSFYNFAIFLPVLDNGSPVGYREVTHPQLQSNWRWNPVDDVLTYDRSWLEGSVTCLDLP